MPERYIKIGDIEVGGSEPLGELIEQAKTLYVWKYETRQAKKTEDDVNLEKIFEETVAESPAPPKKGKKDFVSV
ncbi:MAG: hypothetical protein PHW58_03245 [Candidatus Methanofastidiosa archaeon]|jgi:hypothetical protein|nr:hypothetical protein [Candidatus Methanofastidiosa archaeon]